MAVKSSVLGAGIAGAFLMVLNVGVADAQDGVEGAVAAADATAGQVISFQCIGCHSFGEGEAARVGPNLFGLVGRAVAGVEGFSYSEALLALNTAGDTWTLDLLNAFLTNPQEAVPGNVMPFGGLGADADRYNLLAYLATLTSGD